MRLLKFEKSDPRYYDQRLFKSSGGGGVDTSGLEAATREATALQKQMYEQGREDIQPWYQMGVGSVNKLADLLGVTGGSVKSRDDIYNELLPQYTTTVTSGAPEGAQGAGWYEGMYGKQKYFSEDPRTTTNMLHNNEYWEPLNVIPQQTTTEQVNQDALNAALEERLAQQGQTPEGYGSLLEKFGMDKFEEDPGAQFRRDEANKALERQMAAQGVTLGGAGFGDINPSAARNISELNQNLASQEYQNAYNRFTNDQLNTFNMLMGASGQGSGMTGQMMQGGQAYAQNVGNLTTGLASAQLNAQMAQDAQKSGMFNSMLGNTIFGMSAIANPEQAMSAFMSDRTMKTNITDAGVKNGHKLYEFNYIGDDTRYKGVMAQDLLSYIPEAVEDIDGVLHVNYDLLGIEMEKV